MQNDLHTAVFFVAEGLVHAGPIFQVHPMGHDK